MVTHVTLASFSSCTEEIAESASSQHRFRCLVLSAESVECATVLQSVSSSVNLHRV